MKPNTFIDKRPVSEDIYGYLPHHYCDESDVRGLLRPFDVLKLWAAWGRKANSVEP